MSKHTTHFERMQMISMYRDGSTMAEIGLELGKNEVTVGWNIRKMLTLAWSAAGKKGPCPKTQKLKSSGKLLAAINLVFDHEAAVATGFVRDRYVSVDAAPIQASPKAEASRRHRISFWSRVSRWLSGGNAASFVVAFICLFVFAVVGSSDFRDDQHDAEKYCEMVGLFGATDGELGWPDYNGNAKEVCAI